MKVRKYSSGDDERAVVIAMITDARVLGRITSRWDREGLFSSAWSNMVAGWCIKHYNKYGKAPGIAIKSIFLRWAEGRGDDSTVELVGKFLEALNNQYTKKKLPTDVVLDMAGFLFNKVKLTKLSEELGAHLEAGDMEMAKKAIINHREVELGAGTVVNLLTAHEELKKALTTVRNPIIQYPGALGQFFGVELQRDGFIGFMGAEKRGKSWWLLDVAFRAMKQGRRVAFFEIGDMSEHQLLTRFGVRAARHPHNSKTGWPLKVMFPNDIDPPEHGKKHAVARGETFTFTAPISPGNAIKSIIKLRKQLNDPEALKLSAHANSTIGIAGIQSILLGWERDGWRPDVVVIDYADLLAPPPGYSESRDQINANWKAMRGLSQILHCLVVTATQSKASGYTKDTLDRADFSEDKRKMAHVTGMVGINQIREEKASQIMRLNWVVLREDDFDESYCCHVATCLPLANPAVVSTFLTSSDE